MSRLLNCTTFEAAYRGMTGTLPSAELLTELQAADADPDCNEVETLLVSGARLVLARVDGGIRASVRGGEFFDDAGNVRGAEGVS
jgi:hypothetical protein